jgi:L-methionine (R)-S-oxide reductase
MAHGEHFQVTKGTIPNDAVKSVIYENVALALDGMLASESDPIVIMSTIVAVLHQSMPHYFWTGFYRVVCDELVVGPYQGTPACLRIAKGRGVCGTAWAENKIIRVEDVHSFPGHIACDARSASEIVVPWHDRDGRVMAVLDVDSSLLAAFSVVDETFLSALAAKFPLG